MPPETSRILLSALVVGFISAALLFALLSGNGNALLAQTDGTPTPEATPQQEQTSGVENLPPIEGKVSSPLYSNMDSNLNSIVNQVETGLFAARDAASAAPLHHEESVAVTLYIIEGYADSIVAFLKSNGASPRNIGADYIEAYVPVSLLPSASQQEGVSNIRTIIPPQPVQGAIVSEGVKAHGVPAWHAAGFKGKGVKIGVLDVGFEGFAYLMGSELPSTAQWRCYTDVGVFTTDPNDCIPDYYPESARLHGTAVTEAIFDIAPEAEYYIANLYSLGDLLDTVAWMKTQDVDVINASVGFAFDGPGDGTSPFANSPLNSVDEAVAGGIIWVNAAGNGTWSNWFGPFADRNANGVHDFSATSDDCNGVRIQLGPLDTFTAQLRWDDSWGGAASDLDLYLMPLSGSTFNRSDAVAKSETVQDGGTDDFPYEWINISYGDIPDGVYCLAVNKYKGDAPSWIQILLWGAASTLEHYTPDHSITNPAESANPGLLAAGAAGRSASTRNPFDTTIIEPFSSRGPTTDNRIKPDIVGADAGQSVTYRTERNPNGYFFGTSQASPHVAGLAALVIQRYHDQGLSPAQVARYLKNHAEERGVAGADNTWGHGFARLPPSDVPTPMPSPTPEPSPTPSPPPGGIADHACNEDDLAGLEGYTFDTEGGPYSREDGGYTGVVGSYWNGWFNAERDAYIVCTATQFDSIQNARWAGLNYSVIVQHFGSDAKILEHEQAPYVLPPIGDDMVSLWLAYQGETQEDLYKASEVRFLDSATITLTRVFFAFRNSNEYPDLDQAANVARNIASRVIPQDNASQSSGAQSPNRLPELFGKVR